MRPEWTQALERVNLSNMAAKCVSKILHCVGLRTKGSLNKTATIFRSCITVGVKWSSTSPELQSTPLETENVNRIHERMHVGDIRWLCKADLSSDEVFKLFHRFSNIPVEHRTEYLNSALYWFIYYDKIKEALQLKSLWEKHGIAKTCSTYSSLADLYSKCHHLGNMKEFFDNMKRDGFTPRVRHYAPFLEAGVEKCDLKGAVDSMIKIEQSAGIHERNVNIYTALIQACAGQEDEYLTSKVFEIFHGFREYRDQLVKDNLEAIKLWFDSHKETQWITSWTIASDTFHCQACKQKLETGEFSALELEELKNSLAKHLWKNHKGLKQVKCFTSAGNFIDHVVPQQLNKIPSSIEQFIKSTGPYDVVIDGLNVGYFKGFFDPRKVQNVVLHFVKQNRRVLVVGSSPLKAQARNKRGAQTPLGALMDYLLTNDEQCGVLCLAESTMDDLYFISAAMHCGLGTVLVSSDKFHDHRSEMDPLVKVQFRRWQNLYQMKLKRFVGDSPVFSNRRPFDAAVQTTGDTWHFPSGDGNRWLCVKRQ